MENQILKDPAEFTDTLRKLTTGDRGHAEVFNPLFEALINNDVFLKKIAEKIKKNSDEHIKNESLHVTAEDKKNWSEKAENRIFKKATTSAAGSPGLVPAPDIGVTNRYLKSDGTWGDGVQGETGATGPQGPKGEKGDTGPQGPKGDKGEKGDAGTIYSETFKISNTISNTEISLNLSRIGNLVNLSLYCYIKGSSGNIVSFGTIPKYFWPATTLSLRIPSFDNSGNILSGYYGKVEITSSGEVYVVREQIAGSYSENDVSCAYISAPVYANY